MKARVQRGRAQLRELLRTCCRIELDRRGQVSELERNGSGACGCASSSDKGRAPRNSPPRSRRALHPSTVRSVSVMRSPSIPPEAEHERDDHTRDRQRGTEHESGITRVGAAGTRTAVVPQVSSRCPNAGAAPPHPVPRLPRRLDRERRFSIDQARARVLRTEPAVGRERLRAHLRRIPAARRARRRPRRPPPHPCRRPHPVYARLARRRRSAQRRSAHRRPAGPGHRRRDDVPGRALDHHHNLHQPSRPQHRRRSLGRHSRPRRRLRRRTQRRPHRGPGWRWIFYLNVAVATLACLGALALIARDRRVRRQRSFDLTGAVLVTTGMLLLIYALVQAPTPVGEPHAPSASSPPPPSSSPPSSPTNSAHATRSSRSRSSASRDSPPPTSPN